MKIVKIKYGILLTALLFLIHINTPEVEAKGRMTKGDMLDSMNSVIMMETVSSEANVVVTDVDLGDYQGEMQVGDNQLLMITVLPTNATNQEVTYHSSNGGIATINALGRITAITSGKTEITVKSEKVEKKFTLTINEKAVEKKISVADIEIGEFEPEMQVGKTQTITGTIFPADATKQTIEYSSSNPGVATISSTGKITAVSKGSTTIKLKADGITKEVGLTVKVMTTKIDVNETYVVLKVGSSFQLKAQVLPKESQQALTYKCTNNEVLSVNSSGLIKTLKEGKSSVIISNGDLKKSVTVIVNKEGRADTVETKAQIEDNNVVASLDMLLEVLTNSEEDTVYFEAGEEKTITKDILKYLYESKKTVILLSDGYSITIKGKDIINYENPLSTKIVFEKSNGGRTFVINDNQNIPGKVSLKISENILGQGKYIYLFNKAKDKFELLNTKITKRKLDIDIAGKYLIVDKKITSFKLNIISVIIAVVCLISLTGAYIFIKKKYWFW